jgi:hypothetical protein
MQHTTTINEYSAVTGFEIIQRQDGDHLRSFRGWSPIIVMNIAGARHSWVSHVTQNPTTAQFVSFSVVNRNRVTNNSYSIE